MTGHYRTTKIQALSVIDDWGLDFVSGSILKYLQRQEHKGQAEEDRYKVLWYAAYLVTRSREYADRVVNDAREISNNGR